MPRDTEHTACIEKQKTCSVHRGTACIRIQHAQGHSTHSMRRGATCIGTQCTQTQHTQGHSTQATCMQSTQHAQGHSMHRDTANMQCARRQHTHSMHRDTAHTVHTDTAHRQRARGHNTCSMHGDTACTGKQLIHSLHWDALCTGTKCAQGHSTHAVCAGIENARGYRRCRDTARAQRTQGCSMQRFVVCTGMWARSLGTFEPFRSFSQVQQEAWIVVCFAQVLMWQWEAVGL